MERTLISLTPANVVTVTICGLLGYGLLMGAHHLFFGSSKKKAMAA